jgi:hypothetical protein
MYWKLNYFLRKNPESPNVRAPAPRWDHPTPAITVYEEKKVEPRAGAVDLARVPKPKAVQTHTVIAM